MQTSEVNPDIYHCLCQADNLFLPPIEQFDSYTIQPNSFQSSDAPGYFTIESTHSQIHNLTTNGSLLNHSSTTSVAPNVAHNSYDSINQLSFGTNRTLYCLPNRSSDSQSLATDKSLSFTQIGYRHYNFDSKHSNNFSAPLPLYTRSTPVDIGTFNLTSSQQQLKANCTELRKNFTPFGNTDDECKSAVLSIESVNQVKNAGSFIADRQQSHLSNLFPISRDGFKFGVNAPHQTEEAQMISTQNVPDYQNAFDNDLSWLDAINDDLMGNYWPENEEAKTDLRVMDPISSCREGCKKTMYEFSQKDGTTQVTERNAASKYYPDEHQCALEVERRQRNNEASRRSRAMKKKRFEAMKAEVQRLSSANEELGTLIKELDMVIAEAKDVLQMKPQFVELLAAML